MRIGLCDRIATLERVRDAARELAGEIASSGPLAIESIRVTMRGDLAARIRTAATRERQEQERLQRSKDFREGVAAMAASRKPNFQRQ